MDDLGLPEQQLLEVFRVTRLEVDCQVLVLVDALQNIDLSSRAKVTDYLSNSNINIVISITNHQ